MLVSLDRKDIFFAEVKQLAYQEGNLRFNLTLCEKIIILKQGKGVQIVIK